MNFIKGSELDSFWDAMKREVSPGRYVLATLLIHIMRERLSDNEVTDDKFAFGELLEAAYSVGEINPFDSMYQFKIIYNAARRLRETDWAGAFERELNSSKKTVLSPELVDIYLGRFERLPKTVFVAEAEKFLPGLQKYVLANPKSHFVFSTRDSFYSKALSYAFENYENVEIFLTDVYNPDFTDRKFDLIVSCPAFAGRVPKDDRFFCRDLDMVALQNLMQHLNSDGRLISLHPMRIAYMLGQPAQLRWYIQINKQIIEMAQLPVGSLQSASIVLFMVDIENSQPGTRNTIVRRYSGTRSKGKNGVVDIFTVSDETQINYDKLLEQGDWNVDKMFPMQRGVFCEYVNSGLPVKKLKEVADVLRGMTVSQKDRNGNISIVGISNIGDYGIEYDKLDKIQEEEKKVARFLLEEGDVLIPARGAAIRSAVFHRQPYPCIATSNVMVIRPYGDMLDSTYLKIFIDSPTGNEMVSRFQQSGVIMNISYKDLSAMEIPILPLAEQKKRAKEYNEALSKYQKAISDAQAEWDEVLDRVQNFDKSPKISI